MNPTGSISPNSDHDHAKIDDPRSELGKVSVELIKPYELSSTLTQEWSRLRSQHPHLASPFFDIEFTRCVAEVRDDVEIAVISTDQLICGFFPFQRVARSVALPVGGLMNDYHGMIGSQKLNGYLPEIIRQCKLKSWQFHALEGRTTATKPYEFEQLPCPYIDLSRGFDRYYSHVCMQSSTVRRQRQKSSKMIRELGELRLDFDCRDPQVLESLIRWKRAKFIRTRTFDILSVPWTANLLRSVFEKRSDSFQGLLSALWADEHLVAAHMGLATESILHYWFPAIDVNFGRYSPGTQMFLTIAEQAANQGSKLIDLGYGDQGFKSKWSLNRKYVGCGKIQFGSWRHAISKAAFHLRKASRSIPLKQPLKKVLRKIRPDFGKRAFR